MKVKTAAEDGDDAYVDVLKLLRQDVLRLMTLLVINILETGEWAEEFIEVRMISAYVFVCVSGEILVQLNC
jgi:hypothetical protein